MSRGHCRLLQQHVLLSAADHVHRRGPLFGRGLPDRLSNEAQPRNRFSRVRRHVASFRRWGHTSARVRTHRASVQTGHHHVS